MPIILLQDSISLLFILAGSIVMGRPILLIGILRPRVAYNTGSKSVFFVGSPMSRVASGVAPRRLSKPLPCPLDTLIIARSENRLNFSGFSLRRLRSPFPCPFDTLSISRTPKDMNFSVLWGYFKRENGYFSLRIPMGSFFRD